ncbi:unnamed protein product [[Candida] boidinii]|nr:unnamed protein product [[Candida] boidinii]
MKEEAKKKEVQNFYSTIREDPESDITNGEILKQKAHSAHHAKHAAAKEPKVLDLEDTITDIKTEEAKAVKLDKIKGFMKYKRRHEPYRPAKSRIGDWKELSSRLSKEDLHYQSARCMDCGIPFCQSDTGCPISNVIPKWNELVFKERWYDALQRLLMTNNFPEFTSKICPAPCEGACVVNVSGNAPVG